MGAEDLFPLSPEGYNEKTLRLGRKLLFETRRALCIGVRAYQFIVPWKEGAVCRFKYLWFWEDPREGILVKEAVPANEFGGERGVPESEGNGEEAVLPEAPEGFEADCGAEDVDEGEAVLGEGISEGKGGAEGLGIGGGDACGDCELTAEERALALNDALFALDVLGKEDLERVREALEDRIGDCETEIVIEKRMHAPNKKKRVEAGGTKAGRGKPFGKKKAFPQVIEKKVPKMSLCRMQIRKLNMRYEA